MDFEMAASAFAYFHSGGNFLSAVLGKPGHCGWMATLNFSVSDFMAADTAL